jgi:hypothetical protein
MASRCKRSFRTVDFGDFDRLLWVVTSIGRRKPGRFSQKWSYYPAKKVDHALSFEFPDQLVDRGNCFLRAFTIFPDSFACKYMVLRDTRQ